VRPRFASDVRAANPAPKRDEAAVMQTGRAAGFRDHRARPRIPATTVVAVSLALAVPVTVPAQPAPAAADPATPNGSSNPAASQPAPSQPANSRPPNSQPANSQPANSQPPASQPGAEAPAKAPDDDLWTRDTLTGDWGGLRSSLEDAGVKFGLLEQSELWGNLTGGLHQGVVYDGLTTASLTLDLDKLAGWTGATFFVDAYQIHGRGPDANLNGNLQDVSNIEATRDTKLYQLWLEQHLWDGRLIIRVGQEGANDQMMITQYGALFLNSSFGYPGMLPVDLPQGGPNYPIAAPFVRVQLQPINRITLVGAVFNDAPAPNGPGDPQLRDKGGTAFRLNGHALAFGELWYSVNQQDNAPGLPATYKLGFWTDSARFNDQLFDTNGVSLANPASNGMPRQHSPDFAIYGIVDQMVWQQPGNKKQGIGVFLQIMGAPGQFNMGNLFIEAGLNWMAPFRGRDNDVFGLGVSYLGISPATRRFGSDLVAVTGSGARYASNETVIEGTYLYQATPWLSLQPDVQVIVNPGAGIPSSFSPTPLKNDVIAGVRASIVF
jgi:porin